MNSLINIMVLVGGNTDGTGVDFVTILVIAAVVGFLIALIRILILKGQLTSVYRNDSASDYKRDKSFKVDVEREVFLYSKTEKEEKPNSNQNK